LGGGPATNDQKKNWTTGKVHTKPVSALAGTRTSQWGVSMTAQKKGSRLAGGTSKKTLVVPAGRG